MTQPTAHSIAALIAGRDLSQAVRAVHSDSDRVRATLERVTPKQHTDPFDQWLYSPARRKA